MRKYTVSRKCSLSRKYRVVIVALFILGLWHLPATTQGSDSYIVVVHPNNQAEALSKKAVSRLLLKELAKWDGGQSAQPVDLDSKSETRRDFSRDVHGRSVASIKSYWQRRIFSGRGVPPPEVSSDSAVISHVSSHPGGIGYVSGSASLDGVKVLGLSSN